MVLKKLKAINNSTRNTVLINYKKTLSPTDQKKPRRLFKKIKEHAGRNNLGRITMRHQKGWNKKIYRVVDFKRNKNDGVEGRITSIEYDPNRNCFISLVSYQNGDKSYIITPEGIKVGDKVISGTKNVAIKPGNNLPLNQIPTNTLIHNLEIKPQKGGQFLRSAGSFGEVVGKEEDNYVKVKLRSKEIRKVFSSCRATIGKVGNSEANLVRLGKAGRNVWRGKRPTVRGSAMNACDHPHGGGKSKSPIGRKSPMDPWGNKTLGKKTRKKNKKSNKYIVQTRFRNKKNK